MIDKRTTIFIAILLIASALSFYGGSRYATKATTTSSPQSDTAQGSFRQGGARQRGQGAFSGLVNGKILSRNEQNIVVELRDGGSKIVFVSQGTEVTKFVSGSAADLAPNLNVSVNGDANPDGSITAKTIQLRPEMAPTQGRNFQSTTTVAK
jgi:hypothetical protein